MIYISVCVCVCVIPCLRLCVCVCVRETERDREQKSLCVQCREHCLLAKDSGFLLARCSSPPNRQLNGLLSGRQILVESTHKRRDPASVLITIYFSETDKKNKRVEMRSLRASLAWSRKTVVVMVIISAPRVYPPLFPLI